MSSSTWIVGGLVVGGVGFVLWQRAKARAEAAELEGQTSTCKTAAALATMVGYPIPPQACDVIDRTGGLEGWLKASPAYQVGSWLKSQFVSEPCPAGQHHAPVTIMLAGKPVTSMTGPCRCPDGQSLVTDHRDGHEGETYCIAAPDPDAKPENYGGAYAGLTNAVCWHWTDQAPVYGDVKVPATQDTRGGWWQWVGGQTWDGFQNINCPAFPTTDTVHPDAYPARKLTQAELDELRRQMGTIGAVPIPWFGISGSWGVTTP